MEDNQHKHQTPECSPDTWDPTPNRSNYFKNHRLAGKVIMNRFEEVMEGKVEGGYMVNGVTWTLTQWSDNQEIELDEDLYNACRHAYKTQQVSGREPETDLLEGHLYTKEKWSQDLSIEQESLTPQKQREQAREKNAVRQRDVHSEESPRKDEYPKGHTPSGERPKADRKSSRKRATPPGKPPQGKAWLDDNIQTGHKSAQTKATRRKDILERQKATQTIQKLLTACRNSCDPRRTTDRC
jgi:hypothetical protein